MHNLVKTFLVTVFVAILTFSFKHPANALDDAILAVVNNEVITLRDLQDYVHSTYVSLVAEGRSDREIKEVMNELQINGINKLIEDKLILSRANKLGMEVRDKLIEDKMDSIIKKYKSEQDFVDSLVKNGASLTDLRNKIIDQLKIKYVIEHDIKSKIFVNPQEVTDYYNKHLEKFQAKEQADVNSIFVEFKNNKSAAETKIETALEMLKAGKDFNEVAAEFSESSALGSVERGQYIKSIDDAIFSLKQGEYSPIIPANNGFYIFKLNFKLPARTAQLKDVKDTIYNLIFKDKFRAKFDEWLNKLKKDAYIDIKS